MENTPTPPHPPHPHPPHQPLVSKELQVGLVAGLSCQLVQASAVEQVAGRFMVHMIGGCNGKITDMIENMIEHD